MAAGQCCGVLRWVVHLQRVKNQDDIEIRRITNLSKCMNELQKQIFVHSASSLKSGNRVPYGRGSDKCFDDIW